MLLLNLGQYSGCSDWVDGHDAFAYAGFDDLWNQQKVFRSTQACQSTIKIGKIKVFLKT